MVGAARRIGSSTHLEYFSTVRLTSLIRSQPSIWEVILFIRNL